MDGQMEFGTVFTSDNGYRYKVFRLLGAGGQGEVYDVQKEGEGHYALKWYFPHMATGEQKSILENLLKQGAPSRSFLWPLDLIVDPASHTFGYIMEIRPKNYKSIVDMMKRRAEPSYDALCRAAWNLISGYRTLHSRGYCYRDISFGNVFLDPDDGSILICDNDNVSANGTSGATVYGTPRFMAPEIVTGQAKPSRNTDLYSLAVLLFYMFMMGHPLDGKREAEIRCLDIHAMNQLYGFSPLFVFDPKDHSNRPVAGYQDNVLASWGVYPESLRELFTRAFTDGLKQPNKRITENQWLDAMANMMGGLLVCPGCGQAEVFLDEAKVRSGVAQTCWRCGKQVRFPLSLVCGKTRTLLLKDRKLYAHQLYGDYDMETVAATVTANPKNPAQLGLRNESENNWTYIRPDGQQIPVPKGRSAGIVRDAKICFGQLTGEFHEECLSRADGQAE